MKIEEININNFGNLENKNFKLKKFNIIHGDNEAGKSTLLNFIYSSFYGIEKTKGKKDMSDFDRYLPWSGNDFSGSIKYTLDDGNEFNVFRDFNKNICEIHDKNNKDISDCFEKDRKKGNLFFEQQTGVDRETMLSTVITNQRDVKIDDKLQNRMLEKIANMVESGNEDVSYNKIMNKLKDIQLTEVGSDRSVGRPINRVKENIDYCNAKLFEAQQYVSLQYEIHEAKTKLADKLEEEKKKKEMLKDIVEIDKHYNNEKEKLEIKKKIIDENNSKIIDNTDIIEEKKKKRQCKLNIIFIVINILCIICGIYFNQILVSEILGGIFVLQLIVLFLKRVKHNPNNLIIENTTIESNNNSLINELNKIEDKLDNERDNAILNLVKKYGTKVYDVFDGNVDEQIADNLNKITEIELEIKKLILEEENVMPKIEAIVKYTEERDTANLMLNDLEHKNLLMNIMRTLLEESYDEMKTNVVPKFDTAISKNIKLFSNSKYDNLIFDDELKIKLSNGKIIPITKLSEGTIDQIYLALRLSLIEEMSNEKITIIWDEAFAYTDDKRLKSILETLNKIDNQVIILTCSNREKAIMEKLNVEYEYISI